MITGEDLQRAMATAEQSEPERWRRHDDPAASAANNALIGPNAIVQLHTALLQQLGWQDCQAIFIAADLPHYLHQSPAQLVDEGEVARLHRQVRLHCAPWQATRIMQQAGDLTAQYILARRIPKAVAWLLQHLPMSLSARLLQRAIRRHAWTFAGSGSFRIGRAADAPAGAITASIAHNPVVALESADNPICHWHAAVFQRLFTELVSRDCKVSETLCCAAGDDVCSFSIQTQVK